MGEGKHDSFEIAPDRFPHSRPAGCAGTEGRGGETVISEGGVAHEMFLLRKGRAEIRVKGIIPSRQVGPGGIFGEMALIDQSPRSATVVATEDSEIIPIDERLFVILVQDAPYFALDVMRTLVDGSGR